MNVLRDKRAIAQPNDGFIRQIGIIIRYTFEFSHFRQLEQFESVLVISETVRLTMKYGSQSCPEDRKIINLKMESFNLAVESGVLCQGTCSSRSACPIHTCRSPCTARSFNIFRSRRSSTSSVVSVKRRKSLANQPTLRVGAEKIKGEKLNWKNLNYL